MIDRYVCRLILALCLTVGLLSLTYPKSPGPERIDPSAQPRSTGCGKVAAKTGVLQVSTKDGNGTSRTYEMDIPTSYAPQRAYALYFVLHGGGGNADQSASWGLQKVAGAADNGIFVFPNGLPFKSYGVGWDDGNSGYDMPMFDNIVKAVAADYCVDTARIFVAGFSWGGDFAIALACNRGEMIRAIAVNSATDEFTDRANDATYGGLPCPSHRHPAVRFEHAVRGDAQYPPPYFATTSKLLQHFNACAVKPGADSASSRDIGSSTPRMSCVSYVNCANEVIECFFDDRIGHGLPPHWAEDTWDFFQSFSP